MDASTAFYELALERLGYGPPERGDVYVEWEDLSLGAASEDRPATRGLHLGLLARSSRAEVDGWWEAMTAAGYPDDGAPGPRPQYTPAYYGAFVRDPDGNSVEAVHHGSPRRAENRIDHLWIRVRDLDASRRFFETVAPSVGLHLQGGDSGCFHVVGSERSFALVRDEPVTEHVHVAFPAAGRRTVDEFHRAALAAGFRDNGPPGERDYHPGYYGAYVLDPDGNNWEAVHHGRD
jgi:catechol 2,3-dioxygenase-like lactoylglutathione lyase family enzyme